MKQYDLAIIGAGIMGLAHAVHATRAGLKTVVFEQGEVANGASVRNFGMLAIAAQAPGAQLNSARRALSLWQEIARDAGIAMRQAGCVFLAKAPEEMRVLEERARARDEAGHSFELLSASQLSDHAPGLNPEGLLGGLWSPDAWKVDQRQALKKISAWLAQERGVDFHFSTAVHTVAPGTIDTSAGPFRARHTILCGGDDFDALFPGAFRDAQIGRCRLQMLRTVPQPAGWRLEPFVLGGLSLPRYTVFSDCPGLPDLQAYQHKHFAAHLEHGVHVIACQEEDGSITIGDSHAYGVAADGHRSEEIDRLILEELASMIALPNPQIAERWLGHYAHHPGGKTQILQPDDNVTAVTMTNGQGMTHAFAVAEKVVQDLFGYSTQP